MPKYIDEQKPVLNFTESFFVRKENHQTPTLSAYTNRVKHPH